MLLLFFQGFFSKNLLFFLSALVESIFFINFDCHSYSKTNSKPNSNPDVNKKCVDEYFLFLLKGHSSRVFHS